MEEQDPLMSLVVDGKVPQTSFVYIGLMIANRPGLGIEFLLFDMLYFKVGKEQVILLFTNP